VALGDFGKGKESSGGASGNSAGMGALTAFIDQGSEFSGKLSFRDTVRIDGRFEGEISSDNTLIVGETGQVHADIRSNTVVISGEVRGNIVASAQITLHKSARVFGNLTTEVLIAEEGSELNGQVSMGKAALEKLERNEKGDKVLKRLEATS